MNFFNDPKFRANLAKAAEEARASIANRKPTTAVECGNCFILPGADDLPVVWVAVKKHPDNANLLYFVACDEYHEAGFADVPCMRDDTEETLRGGVGLWLDRNHIPLDRFVGTIDVNTIDILRGVLASWVTGELSSTEEASPEYEEWITELQTAANRVEATVVARHMLGVVCEKQGLELTPADTAMATADLIAAGNVDVRLATEIVIRSIKKVWLAEQENL